MSHHRDAGDVRVKIVHMCDRRIPLVERVTFPNKQPGSFLIRFRHVRHRTAPLQQLDIRVEYQLIEQPCPSGPRKHEAKPSGLKRRALHFFGMESLVCSLIIKGRLLGWSLILQRCTSLLGDTQGVTLQSRQGTRSSFWGIHGNHY